MLVTLRLQLTDGKELLISRELEPVEASLAPREILERASRDGRVALGDRDSCSLSSVVRVEVVEPEPRAGPVLEQGIRDEDVASALDGNFKPTDE